MLNITQTVLDTVRREWLFTPGDTVYVALSGGADSVMLLHVLCELKDTLSLKDIRALHVNHGIRGEYADRDEQFVREMCKALRIPLEVERANVPAIVKQTHKTVEEAARDVRYAFFQKQTEGVEGAKIATAHTADDRAESVLHHLIRGCGLHGLCGIPYRRDNIVRPLLDCSAQQVRDCAAQHNIAFVIDETNTDEGYTRNFIRHRILPAMQLVNPAVVSAILRLSDQAVTDDTYLQSEAEIALKSAKTGRTTYHCEVFTSVAAPIATRALCSAFYAVSENRLEQRHVSELLDIVKHGGAVTLPGDWIAKSDRTTLRFERANRTKGVTNNAAEIPLSLNTPLSFCDKCFTAEILTAEESSKMQKIHKNLLDFCIDYDMIFGAVCLRSRLEGDTFRPHKRHCTKTLKQFFQEQGVAANDRDTVPLLCDEKGILAIIGHAVDERAAVHKGSTNILYIHQLSEGSE